MHRTPIAIAAIAASLILPGASIAQTATAVDDAPARTAETAHGRLADVLAEELGLARADVKAALEANRPAPGERPTDAQRASLASALGVSLERLDALMRAHAPKGGPRLPIARIAAETGRTQAEVRAAFEANRPEPGQRPTDAQRAATAAALGVTSEQLDALMREYAPAHAPGGDAQRTAPAPGAQRP